MASFQRLRALFCLTVVWLCAWAITPALAQTPSPPTTTLIYDDVFPRTGTIFNGDSTNDARPSLFGNAAPNNALTAQIYANGILIGSTTVDANGTWSFTPSSNLSDGTQSFTVTVTNSGDTSLPSTPYVVTVDTIPPLPPVLTNVTTSGSGGSSQFTFTGTAETNTFVSMYLNGVLASTTSVSANGQWTLTTAPVSTSGTQAFTAQAVDLAGNSSALTRPFIPLANDFVAMLSGGGQAQVAIDSDTAGCTVNTQPAFVQANLSGAPANATAPLGALTFGVTGCPGATLTVRITYPAGSLATLTPYKFGPASSGVASTWFAHGSVVGDSVIYIVTDNGVGDSNPAPGVIADPFAPMLLAAPGPATVQHVPTLGQWALVLLTVLLAGLGLHTQRRKALV